MQQINWKIRLNNPTWWAQVAAAVVLPLVAGVGASWGDMTSWAALAQTVARALGNPVVVVSMVVSVYNALIDPTTKGVGDSARALGYDEPAPTQGAGGSALKGGE